MSDEIKLSLDPTPAAPQITLTLDGTPAPAPTVQPVDKKNPLVEQAEQRTAFSPEEQKQIDEFAQKNRYHRHQPGVSIRRRLPTEHRQLFG